MTAYIITTLIATNASAIIAALVYRHQAQFQRARADALKAETQRETKARQAAEAAANDAKASAAALSRMVEAERDAAAARIDAERKAAASAADINRRAQEGDPSALRSALDDLEGRR